MKLAISYFYQIRHFKPNMIPVSTAWSDPQWYHNFTRDKSFTFVDKRGIVNGLRCEELHGDETCDGLCPCEDRPHEKCEFLTNYKKMLTKLDLPKLLERCEKCGKDVQDKLGFEEEPIIVFIVYEAPWNKCSERWPLLEYFKEQGIECKELEYPIK